MAEAALDLCIHCDQTVRPRQHAVTCDVCERWQHRTCGTGITLQQYRDATRNRAVVHFICHPCEERNWPNDQTLMEFDREEVMDTQDHPDQPPILDDHPDQPPILDDHPPILDDHPDQPPILDDHQDQPPILDDHQDRPPIHEDHLPINDDFPDRPPPDLNATFDMPHRQLEDRDEQQPPDESVIVPEEMPADVLPNRPITYTLLENGSKRGGKLLTSSDGFTYTVKTTNKNSVLWTCSKRSKKYTCYATIRQKGDIFVRGPQQHGHEGNHSTTLTAQLSAEIKKRSTQQIFRPAMEIVEDVVTEIEEERRFLMPKQSLLKRAANLYRSKFRPQEPKDLNFVIDEEFLKAEDFLIADIRVDDQRHIIFGTDFQLQLLRQARQWFMDGTFRIVKDPFKSHGQLMSIHAFVQKDGNRKQFPLVFALMSRKTKEDYIKILKAVKDRLQDPVVDSLVLDFERGAWLAARDVFPNIQIQGCAFHWTQAVWRHVQDLGLVTTYRERGPMHNYIRQLLALPFLPAAHIRETFDNLRQRASTPELRNLTDYMELQWMDNSTFGTSDWSVFGKTIRTNNDVEGWHNRLNSKAGHLGLTFYRLVPLLRREAELVKIRVTAADLERDHNRRKTDLERRLQTAWDSYMANDLTTSAFLRTVSHLYAPPS